MVNVQGGKRQHTPDSVAAVLIQNFTRAHNLGTLIC